MTVFDVNLLCYIHILLYMFLILHDFVNASRVLCEHVGWNEMVYLLVRCSVRSKEVLRLIFRITNNASANWGVTRYLRNTQIIRAARLLLQTNLIRSPCWSILSPNCSRKLTLVTMPSAPVSPMNWLATGVSAVALPGFTFPGTNVTWTTNVSHLTL